MSVEKENALTALGDRIAGMAAAPMVTRDLSKRATLSQFPAVFIVEGDDEIVESHKRPDGIIHTRHFTVASVAFIEGTTGELAPVELSTFQDALRLATYADQNRKLGDYGAGIYEQSASHVAFLKIGNNVVAQATIWKIVYKEHTGRLSATP